MRIARRWLAEHACPDLVIEAWLFTIDTHLAAGGHGSAAREATALQPVLHYSGL